MIRHCVLVKYRPEIGGPERDAINADLAALKARLPGMLSFRASSNVSPEGLGKGFEAGFIIDFVDVAARDAYLDDPEHKAVGARIGAAAQDGSDGILVFDFDLGQ